MFKQVIECYCDLCGKLIESKKPTSYELFVWTNCEWTEGRAMPEHLEKLSVELCADCLKKAIPLKCGFRGQDLRIDERQ